MRTKRLVRAGLLTAMLVALCVALFLIATSHQWQSAPAGLVGFLLVGIPVLGVAASWDLVSAIPYARRARWLVAPAIFFASAGPALRFLYSHDPSVPPPDSPDGSTDKAYALYLIFCYGIGILGFGVLVIRLMIRAISKRLVRAQAV
jgi:hypothetical protein